MRKDSVDAFAMALFGACILYYIIGVYRSILEDLHGMNETNESLESCVSKRWISRFVWGMHVEPQIRTPLSFTEAELGCGAMPGSLSKPRTY
jgi:hypothetical protein